MRTVGLQNISASGANVCACAKRAWGTHMRALRRLHPPALYTPPARLRLTRPPARGVRPAHLTHRATIPPLPVFSSSATVYGDGTPPFKETSQTGVGITNPYGWTKYMAERILTDVQASAPAMGVVLLRYFNPVGGHRSGTMGEDPAGVPNNLMPYIQRVAAGRLRQLTVYGDDWATEDGTALRDYLHVVDLARGHLAALNWVFAQEEARRAAAGAAGASGGGVCEVFNLGTGRPASVKQVITAFEAASQKPVPYVVGPRRPGDVQGSWADASKAAHMLGWNAEKTLAEMCEDSWRWVSENPTGYGGGK